MEEVLVRFFGNLIGRIEGPLSFRIILQPCMAGMLAVIDGLRDAREGRPAFLWAALTRKTLRWELLRSGWKSVARVLILAIVIDLLYQAIVLRWAYPLEALATGFMLAVLPYLILRGPVNRIARRFRKG